jgi:hypothetical protein
MSERLFSVRVNDGHSFSEGGLVDVSRAKAAASFRDLSMENLYFFQQESDTFTRQGEV